MKLAELEHYFSVFACASAYLHFVLPFFHFAVPPRFPPSLSLTLLPFQLFQRRGRRRTSSLPSPPPPRRPLSSPREPCRLWSRTTATTSHRARRRGKRRRRGRPPSCSPEDSGLRYVPTDVSSMFSCRNKRLTRYHPLSICLRGNRTIGPREDDGKDRCTGAAVSLF